MQGGLGEGKVKVKGQELWVAEDVSPSAIYPPTEPHCRSPTPSPPRAE